MTHRYTADQTERTITTSRLPLLHHITSDFAFTWTPTAQIGVTALTCFLNDVADWLPLFRNNLDDTGNPTNHTYIEFAKGHDSIQIAGNKGLYFDPDDGTCQRVIDELTTALIGHEEILIWQEGDPPPPPGDNLGYIKIMLGPQTTARMHTALSISSAIWMRNSFQLLLNQYNSDINDPDYWDTDTDENGNPNTFTYGNDPKPHHNTVT